MIKNFIILTGKDEFHIYERIKFYKKAFSQKYENGEIEYFKPEDSITKIKSSIQTPNLFGEKRLIILEKFWNTENFEKAQKNNFFEILPKYQELCTIICIEPVLDKRTKMAKFLVENVKIEIFEPLQKDQIIRWIISYAKKNGGEISFADAKFFLEYCGVVDWSQIKPDWRTKKIDWKKVEDSYGHAGENLWNFANEIKKLISASENQIITKELIKKLISPNFRTIIWDFLADVSAKNIIAAIKKLKTLFHMGSSPHQIFSMLYREISILIQILTGLKKKLSPKEIASETSLHPFVVQKTIPNAQKFSFAELKLLYDELFFIDKKLKTGEIYTSSADTGEFELMMEKFLLKMV